MYSDGNALGKGVTTTAGTAKHIVGSVVPTLNFAMMLSFIVAVMYLAGWLEMYDKCPLDEDKGLNGACTIINTKSPQTCKSWKCQGWTITVIAMASIWFILQTPWVGRSIANQIESDPSKVQTRLRWANFWFGLPLVLGIVSLLVFAIFIIADKNDPVDDPSTSPSAPSQPSEAPVIGILGMLLLVGLTCFFLRYKQNQCMTWANYLSKDNRGAVTGQGFGAEMRRGVGYGSSRRSSTRRR